MIDCRGVGKKPLFALTVSWKMELLLKISAMKIELNKQLDKEAYLAFRDAVAGDADLEVLYMKIRVVDAIFPRELELQPRTSLSGSMSSCPGDGCNSDQGGCESDASCGQDC